MKQTLARLGSFAAGVCFLLSVSPAYAVDLNTLKVPIIERGDLLGILANILNVVLLWGGIIAFFYAIYGGFLYMTSGGDPAGAEKGRKTIINAVIGIILIFLSYIIITYVINLAEKGFNDGGKRTTTGTGAGNPTATPTPKVSSTPLTSPITSSPTPGGDPSLEPVILDEPTFEPVP
jgi:hypothetical protein